VHGNTCPASRKHNHPYVNQDVSRTKIALNFEADHRRYASGVIWPGVISAVVLHSASLRTPAYRIPLRTFRALCLVLLFFDFSATVCSTFRRPSFEIPRIF